MQFSTLDAVRQLESHVCLQVAGGPKIDMQYGRKDGEEIGDTTGLPAASGPYPDEETPQGHLRKARGATMLTFS